MRRDWSESLDCPTIERLIEVREDILKIYPSSRDFHIIIQEEYESHYVQLEFTREETEDELKAIARSLRIKEEMERETYLRLKKKFGDSDV